MDELPTDQTRFPPGIPLPAAGNLTRSHRPLSSLVQKLIAQADKEEQLLKLLAEAVSRGNRDDVFLLATQLTKTFLTDSKHRPQPK